MGAGGRPHGYDGAVIIWGILDAHPKRPEELIHHQMASRTPFALHLRSRSAVRVCTLLLRGRMSAGFWGSGRSIRARLCRDVLRGLLLFNQNKVNWKMNPDFGLILSVHV